jgi:hypothetical protein
MQGLGPREVRHRAVEDFGPNFGPLTPKHQRKPGTTRDQRARRINKLENLAKSAKPPSPVQIRAAPPILSPAIVEDILDFCARVVATQDIIVKRPKNFESDRTGLNFEKSGSGPLYPAAAAAVHECAIGLERLAAERSGGAEGRAGGAGRRSVGLQARSARAGRA